MCDLNFVTEMTEVVRSQWWRHRGCCEGDKPMSFNINSIPYHVTSPSQTLLTNWSDQRGFWDIQFYIAIVRDVRGGETVFWRNLVQSKFTVLPDVLG